MGYRRVSTGSTTMPLHHLIIFALIIFAKPQSGAASAPPVKRMR